MIIRSKSRGKWDDVWCGGHNGFVCKAQNSACASSGSSEISESSEGSEDSGSSSLIGGIVGGSLSFSIVVLAIVLFPFVIFLICCCISVPTILSLCVFCVIVVIGSFILDLDSVQEVGKDLSTSSEEVESSSEDSSEEIPSEESREEEDDEDYYGSTDDSSESSHSSNYVTSKASNDVFSSRSKKKRKKKKKISREIIPKGARKYAEDNGLKIVKNDDDGELYFIRMKPFFEVVSLMKEKIWSGDDRKKGKKGKEEEIFD